MPRQPRYFVPDIPQHVIQRGVDRQAVFFQPKDCRRYLDVLQKSADLYECDVHAYVLMTNHVHLLLTPRRERSIPLLIQAMGRGYVQQLNRSYKRTGTLWEGRYKASLVQSDRYLLACYKYIELNPVRAGMVDAPGQYAYSSYRCNALGQDDSIVVAHDTYKALGKSDRERRARYRELCLDGLEADLLKGIRETLNACHVLGDDRFKDQIEAMLKRSVRPGKSGRPRKTSNA